MSTTRYAAEAFLDGFTSMSSIFGSAKRPGSEEPLFLADTSHDESAVLKAGIMVEVERFLHEVQPLIVTDRTAYTDSQALLKKIESNKELLSAFQSGA